MDNKYEFIRLVIKRVRQLINEKEKMGLIGSDEKFTTIALREVREGKLKVENFMEEK
jgi:DNA-directed RNA polymerase omega subunit